MLTDLQHTNSFYRTVLLMYVHSSASGAKNLIYINHLNAKIYIIGKQVSSGDFDG